MTPRSKKRAKAARQEKAKQAGKPTLGRNDPCPCGSGKKTKKCCLRKIQAIASIPPEVRDAMIANYILQPRPTQAAPVPAAVAARFAAVQAAQAAADPESTAAQVAAGMTAAEADYSGIVQDAAQAVGLPAPVATPDGWEIPVESGTIQQEGCAPIQLRCGTLFVDAKEGTP